VRLYASLSVKAKPSLHKSRVAEKSVKRAPNLQDLLCLTVFIYIIYLLTILLRFRLPGLKYIYLLWEHHTKSIAEFSYSLLRGSDFSLQISLPGVIPDSGSGSESWEHLLLSSPWPPACTFRATRLSSFE
jgi:hypothetical protein